MEVSCCSALATAHPGLSIALPNTSTYTAIESSYWSLQESSLQPSCIVTPHSSRQVSSAVTFLTTSSSCKKVDFAIKGRTHAPAAGFANIDGGVTIDMTGISDVSLSDDGDVASVGAGASWLDVYAALDPEGKTVAGGRNGAVGVGGLTLGGGISYWSPFVGFTCDTVQNFEIVLASGEVVDANKSSRPDLFRALKGGTNNFGVVTRIDYATVSIPKQILGGGLVNEISDRTAVFEAFSSIAGSRKYDQHASIVVGLIYNATSRAWVLISHSVGRLKRTALRDVT